MNFIFLKFNESQVDEKWCIRAEDDGYLNENDQLS
jgi:hypothetical protein